MKKQIAIIGASGGIGQKLCELFEEKNNYLIHKLNSKNLDITKKQQVENFFQSNAIDIVINLSAYNYDSFLHKYDELKQEELSKQINVNINGTINILSSCLPQMRKNKFGRIILVSSVVKEKPVIGTSIYGASKAFIESITKTACLENAGLGITINSLRLGYFDAGLLYKIDEEKRNTIKENIPMKRWGTIEELYNAIIFLIETPYCNGSVLEMTGGL